MPVALPPEFAAARWISRDPDLVSEITFSTGPQERPIIAGSLGPVLVLRRELALLTAPVRATLAITARGLYVARFNGKRVGDAVLTPGWTDYHHRLPYQTYDVTDLLTAGDTEADVNVWTVEIAPGWYSGFVGMDLARPALHYGTQPSLLAALTVEFADGSQEVVVTDEDWAVGTGAIRYGDLLMGQQTDHRRAVVGLDSAGADLPGFQPAHVTDPDTEVAIELQRGPDLTITETRWPESIERSPSGALVVDFGQNLVGRVRLSVPATEPGRHVHLRHAEALGPDGEIYTENLRSAQAHDIVVSNGEPVVFDPEFTYHGFRYVEIRGYPGDLDRADIRALVLGPTLPMLGTFSCSDAAINQLHSNITWTIRSNLVGAPTDCPQRDERLGWMGDAQVISGTMAYLHSMSDYSRKWLVDIRDGQFPDGSYPDVAPRVVADQPGAPGWADAGVLFPWRVYRADREIDILADHYPSMVRFAESLERANPDFHRTRAMNHNYGDWLTLDTPTTRSLLATAYWKLDADALALTASALGEVDDAAHWLEVSTTITEVFVDHYVSDDGRVGNETQTGYAMALMGQLVPAELRPAVAERLVADIRKRGTALTTGIHGVRFLLPALCDAGYPDVAHELVLRHDYPSWLHAVDHGATTIWERWDGYTDDAGFQDPGMNSLNHYALGAVGEWLHGWLGGLRPGAQGYSSPIIRPYPGPRLNAASLERETPSGKVASSWYASSDGRFSLNVTVPFGTGATIHVPTTRADSIDSPLARTGEADGWVSLHAPMGDHTIIAEWTPAWRPAAVLPDPGYC